MRIFVLDEFDENLIRFGYKNNFITALDSFISGKPSDLWAILVLFMIKVYVYFGQSNGIGAYGLYGQEKMDIPIVWIIDDDIIARFAATYKFGQSSKNCEVIGHPSAFAGLSSLGDCLHGSKKLPDVLLLDIDMSGMDGWCFLKELEKMGGTVKSIHVYILSAFTSYRDRDRAKENSLIQGFFNKPLSTANVDSIFKCRET